jgi:DNA (cytosine-5)-methyltransferase 1
MKKGFLTYGTICSGIEAPSLAWESLGWEPLWFSEIEPFPSAVLSHHYPDVPNLGDFTAPEAWQHMIDNPPDILFGGTPCQAFSMAGQRQSLEDERGNLTLKFVELWHELRANGTKYAVWENVPGVLNTPDNAFGCFLAGMVGERDTLLTPREGWSNSGVVSGPEGVIAWTVKDAQHYGVPQRRRRIFAVVGHPGDFSPSEILFKPESVSGHPEKGKEEREEVARDVGASTYEAKDGREIDVSPCSGDTRNGDGSGNGLGVGKEGESSPTLTSGDRHAVGFHARQDPIHARGKSLPLEAKGGQAVGIDSQCNANKEGIGTIPSSGNGQTSRGAVHSDMVVRRLTPVECERLMGMPDNWTQIPWRGKPKEECPDGNRYKAIGNSIAVPCLGWIGERIGDL